MMMLMPVVIIIMRIMMMMLADNNYLDLISKPNPLPVPGQAILVVIAVTASPLFGIFSMGMFLPWVNSTVSISSLWVCSSLGLTVR